MPEIPGVQAKISADVSTYLRALVDCAGATKQLGDVSGLTKDEIIKLIAAQDAEAGKLLQLVDATEHWTDAQQRQAMAISAAHDQALRFNETLDHGREHAEGFGEELLKMVGLGAAVGGGMEVAAKGLELVKEATVGSVESFVEFGHGLDLIHEKLNVPLEVAAAWEQSASVTGMSAERVAGSLAMMDQRLATENKQAIAAVNELGISFTELRDAAPEKQVEMLADALAHAEASGVKADVVIKGLMGRGGLGMLPFLTEHAQELMKTIEQINGPLADQVSKAKEYETNAALLSAHWADIRRDMTAPLVGGLAELFGRLERAGPGALVAPWWGAKTDTVAPTREEAWQSAMGGLLGEGPPRPEPHVAAYVSQAERDAAAKKVKEEQADYTRRLIALEKEYQVALAGESVGLNATIEKIKANTAAKIEAIETDTRLTTSHRAELEADAQRVGAAQESSAKIAFARKEEALAAKLAAETSAATDKYWMDIDKQVAEQVVGNVHAETRAREGDVEATRLALAVDEAGASASRDLARAHNDAGDAIDYATQRTLDHIAKLQANVEADANLTAAEKELLLAKLEVAAATEKEAGEAEHWKQQLRQIAHVAQGTSEVIGEFMGLLEEFGDHTSPQFRREMDGLGKAVGGLGEVAQGYASGNYAQAIIGLIHMAEGIHRMLVAPESEKIMNDIGIQWGFRISEGLAKAIESTEMKDHVNRQMAELLNLDAIMGEKGGDPDKFWYHINDLMQAVALGAVPAREGLDQLGKAWQTLRTDAEAGSVASEAAMVAMIKRAQELGENIPGMKAYLLSTLQGGAGSLEAFFAGQGNTEGMSGGFTANQRQKLLDEVNAGRMTPAEYQRQKSALMAGGTPNSWSSGLAGANETILGATFGALSGQEGVIKAAEDLQKAFDELMKHVPPGVPLDASLQHMQVIEELLQHEDFKKAAEASAAGGDTLKALLDTGNLNQRTTDAFATATKSLLQQSIKAATDAGYDPEEARVAGEEANLPLLTQLQHAQELGTKLDPDSEAMLAQAQKDGILPLKTVAEQQLDELRGINRNTGGGGAGGGGRGNGGEGHGAPEEPRGEGGSGRGEGGAVRSFGLGGNVNRTAPTFEYSTNRGHAAAAGDGGGAGGPVHVTFGPIHVNGANAAEIAKGLQEEIRRSGASGLVAEVQRKLIQSYGR